MSDNIISPSDAGLLLHKFVTEGLPVLAYFVSADRCRTAKFTGFLLSFTQAKGLVVGTESPLLPPERVRLPAYMTFSHDEIAASDFTYADETTMPESSGMGSGLRIHLPNGDTLTIIEVIHPKK
jgi:hypothetical protein